MYFLNISDTKYFEDLINAYSDCNILMVNMVFNERRIGPQFRHLCLEDVEKLINGITPEVAIITHFGMGVWKAQPWTLAQKLEQQTGIKTIAARDGMCFVIEADQAEEKGQSSLESF